jgi:hypothetical protein
MLDGARFEIDSLRDGGVNGRYPLRFELSAGRLALG